MSRRSHGEVPLHLRLLGAVRSAPGDQHSQDDVPEVVVVVQVKLHAESEGKMMCHYFNHIKNFNFKNKKVFT